MSLTGKYELGTTISSAAVAFDRSIEGHQISTGRPIAVHLLAGGYNPENQKLLREIAALPPEYKACFLESGDYNGTPYIVTDSLAGTPPFRSWFSALQARRSGSGGGPADLGQVKAWQIPVRVSSQAPVKPLLVPQYDPGEATQLIEIPSLPPNLRSRPLSRPRRLPSRNRANLHACSRFRLRRHKRRRRWRGREVTLAWRASLRRCFRRLPSR